MKNRIDVELIRRNGVTEAAAKEAVSSFVQIPSPYIGKVELVVNAETVELYSMECDSVELSVKTRNVLLDHVIGTVEINCNLDRNVVCHSLKGGIAVNQISATSKICSVLFLLVYRVHYFRLCMGLMAFAVILDRRYLSQRVEGARSFLCAEFPDQRKPDGISDNLGIREE